MSHISRIACAAVVACAMAWTAEAGIDQQKREVVRATLEQLGRLDTGAALIDAADQAQAIEDIQFDGTDGNLCVAVKTTGAPAINTFAMDGGTKIVLDIQDTINLRSGKKFALDSGSPVKNIRTSLFAIEPKFVSRVVVDLATPCTFETARDEGSIKMTLKPGQQTSVVAKAPATPPEPAPVIETPPESIQVTVEPPQPEPADTTLAGHLVLTALNRSQETLGSLKTTAEAAWTRGKEGMEELARKQEAEAAKSEPAKTEPVESVSVPAPAVETLVAQPDPSADRVTQLAHDLESVKASQAELDLSAMQPNAAVAEEQAKQEEAPKAEAPAVEEAKPAEPAENVPPPPDKRSVESEKPAEVGARAAETMKKLVSSISEAAKGTQAAAAEEAKPAETVASKKSKDAPAEPPVPVIVGDPMNQIVNIDFREMDLTNVVALLAQKAQINIIAGTDLQGVVTASLKNVTLRRAMDTVLRMNGLGMVEEEGIYRIVPYEEAIAAKRKTVMVKLENAKASELKKTLEEVLKGSPEDTTTSISSNETTNLLILSGQESRVTEFEALAKELDVAKPVTPTVTEAIKINNADPKELNDLVSSMLTKEVGKVAMDERSRHLVVTDQPIVLEQVRELIKQVDLPVKQVSIDAMIVDAVLSSNSETGVDWITNALHPVNRRGQQIGSMVGPTISVDSTGDIIQRSILSDMTRFGSGMLTMGILTDDLDLKGSIAAQINKNNARLLANPVVVTVENKKASINISEEIPYQESKQSLTGPPMVSTAFKDIGITLEVTPKVSHDDHVIAEINAKQSRQNGTFNAIPIEAKRTTETTLRMRNGQTIFIGGLRRFDDSKQGNKVPVLGDIPVMNIFFRNNVIQKQSTELLVFLTCNVLPDEMPGLSPEMQEAHDQLDNTPRVPSSGKELRQSTLKPWAQDPVDKEWHWRRAK